MKIKGLVLHSRKEFVIEHFGEDVWEQVLQALPAGDREILGGVVFAGQWVPFDLGERLDKAIVEMVGQGDERVFEEIGAKSARRSLAKEHRSFLSPGDPQSFMNKADIIYKFYYDTGPDSGVMTTYEAETFSAADCLTVIGWYKQALELNGAKEVEVVEEACRAKGGSCCRYRLQWKT